MRDYGKVHTKFWSSKTIQSLTEDGRLLALYLLTCEHSTIAGVFRIPDGYVCEDIDWGIERVREGFKNLCDKGFANRCETTKWVWIREHLKWNAPENPNQRKSARKIALTIPEDTAWRSDFMRVCGDILEIPAPPEESPSETVSEPFLNQKQEQEQKQELTDADASVVADGAGSNASRPDCPHQKIVDLYHEILPVCPQVRDWTPARQQHLRARWNEDPTRQHLAYWRGFFEYIREHCGFLLGQGKVKEGQRPFLADLEWMVKQANFTKIREGRYESA